MKYYLLLLGVITLSCNTIDLEAEKSQIISQIDLIKHAHLEKDAETFFKPNADSWIDIRNGQIQEIEKDSRILGTQEYLNKMEFLQLETLGEPIIEISNDATLATYSSRVLVKGKLDEVPILWIVAWQNTLKKIDGTWHIIGAINTEANAFVSAIEILSQVRKQLGNFDSINSISALADCRGPEGNPFSTLIYSNEENGRMEQLSGERHIILKHGNTSWGKNFVSGVVYDSLNTNMQVFAKSHELHWLSIWPESRYHNASFTGIVDFNNKKAFKISYSDDLDKPVNFYYDFESYLPLAFDIEIDDQGSKVITHFENWQEIEGKKLFRNATFDQGGLLFTYNYTDIKLNELEDEAFANQDALILK